MIFIFRLLPQPGQAGILALQIVYLNCFLAQAAYYSCIYDSFLFLLSFNEIEKRIFLVFETVFKFIKRYEE